jgi:hypothetical protein
MVNGCVGCDVIVQSQLGRCKGRLVTHFSSIVDQLGDLSPAGTKPQRRIQPPHLILLQSTLALLFPLRRLAFSLYALVVFRFDVRRHSGGAEEI